MGGRSSFLLFFAVTDSEPIVLDGGVGFSASWTERLRGRPPLAPLARLTARRFMLEPMGELSRAKASRSPDVFRCCEASPPVMSAVRALNRLASSSGWSEACTSAIRSVLTAMLSVDFMVSFWFLFGF